MTTGQYLERPTLIPLPGGLVLEGLAHRGARAPGLLVLPPPPVEGGGMDHVVGAELAFAVSRQGHSTLRFNYRGVGGSQGAVRRSAEAWLEDATEALALAQDNAGSAPAAVASIGASDAVALELARRGVVAGVILVSPSLVRPEDLDRLEAPPWPLGVILPELAATPGLGAWSRAVERLHGELTVVPQATAAYARNLPLVGKAAAALVARASRSTARRD